jgi:hypothetical protein
MKVGIAVAGLSATGEEDPGAGLDAYCSVAR